MVVLFGEFGSFAIDLYHQQVDVYLFNFQFPTAGDELHVEVLLCALTVLVGMPFLDCFHVQCTCTCDATLVSRLLSVRIVASIATSL